LYTDQKEVREEQSKYKKGTHKKRDIGSKQLKR